MQAQPERVIDDVRHCEQCVAQLTALDLDQFNKHLHAALFGSMLYIAKNSADLSPYLSRLHFIYHFGFVCELTARRVQGNPRGW